MADVTHILVNWSRSSDEDRGAVVEALYDELRVHARRHLRGESRVELQPTGLVNEAYMRLVRIRRMDLKSRAHFFGVAGRIMREVLIDEARKLSADKRGGGWVTQLTADPASPEMSAGSLAELADVLARLAALDPVYLGLVDARVFGGLTLEEAAEQLSLPLGTAKRKWRVAVAWLREELSARGHTETVPAADVGASPKKNVPR